MSLTEIRVEGYRSIRDLRLELVRLNVITGPNGCGKSNLYNSLRLLASAAQGDFARSIAREGGTSSVFWAGGERIRYTRKAPPKRVLLSFEAEHFGYELQAGLPAFNSLPLGTLFSLDPEVKFETVWPSQSKRRPLMLDRRGPSAFLRNTEGSMVEYPFSLRHNESVLAQIVDPHNYPEISVLRSEILGWRFYHHFRTDATSPIRFPQVGVQTTVLSHDGSDLGAALRTIQEIGDDEALSQAIEHGLGGAKLIVEHAQPVNDQQFVVSLQTPGILRPLSARELSDGQLRYLCLCAALLSPRPPSLLALNEPESSLHPDLLEPLGKLIVRASSDAQIWVTTHSRALASVIEEHSSVPSVNLTLVNGETKVKMLC